MKNLKDTILEKLKVDDIIPDKEKFPIDGKPEEIPRFLKKFNYEEIDKSLDWEDTINALKHSSRAFSLDDYNNHESFEFFIIDNTSKKYKGQVFYFSGPINHYERIKYGEYAIFENINDAIKHEKDHKNGKLLSAVDKEEFMNKLNEIFA